jgi:hypothetical protein
MIGKMLRVRVLQLVARLLGVPMDVHQRFFSSTSKSLSV